jgi:hypothetical protein
MNFRTKILLVGIEIPVRLGIQIPKYIKVVAMTVLVKAKSQRHIDFDKTPPFSSINTSCADYRSNNRYQGII